MGKGSRNRQLHQQDKMDNPQKYKELEKQKKKKAKKPMPKWVYSVISIVLLVAVVLGIGASVINKYGFIKRSRVIIDSQTGDFDVTQQIASYVAWKNIYYDASMYWLYCKYGIYEDTYGITKDTSKGGYTQDQYALTIAQTSLQDSLRDSIDGTMDALIEWVAVCDAATKAGVKLDADDEAKIEASVAELRTVAQNYGYGSLNGFLAVAMFDGMRESDIVKAETMSVLYNKYCTMMQVSFEKAVVLSDLEAFRDANPEDYYKIDYLTYAADNKEFAEALAAAENAEQFKEMILLKHFENNYKTAFNKYTTQVEVSDIVAELKPLVNANKGTALSDKLDSLGVPAAETFTKGQEGLNESLSKWLFDSARKKDEIGSVATDNGIYLVMFCSDAASTESVSARAKLYAFVEGESYDGDEKFKENILTYLKESKKTDPAYPEVTYKDAIEYLTEFAKAYKDADEAGKATMMTENGKVNVAGVTGTTEADKIPEALRDEITGGSYKKGDTGKIENKVTSYFFVITNAVDDPESYDVEYVTFTADTYHKIINDLQTSLNSVYPTDKNINLTIDAKADTFEAWISERPEGSATTSARKEFDTKYFTVTKTDDKTKVETTTYNVYMVINQPMYLETETSVNGGYLTFSGTKAQEEAEAAYEKIKGKTYAEALSVLSTLKQNSSPTTSVAMKEASVSDANLKKWFFEDERATNDIAVVKAATGTGVYLAVCIEKNPAWQNNAKANYVGEQITDWLDELCKDYSANENVLDKFGEPSTTAASTATEDHTH